MRTTVDLPQDLMRAAKTQAAERGESLKELFARAIAHEVRRPASRPGGSRVTLPVVASRRGPRADVSNADIEVALSADDADRYGGQ